MKNSTVLIKELQAYWHTFLNFIYPRNIHCILCNEPIDRNQQYSLCEKCKAKLTFIGNKTCSVCGKPLDEIYLNDRCIDCIDDNHYFTKAISCVEYDENSKKIIYDLKYHKKRYLSYHISEIMTDIFIERFKESIDIIIPVPLHKKKERKRTFNQAYLIAKYLGKSLEIPVDKKSLIRIKKTETQNKLSRRERKENLKDAFQITSYCNIKDKNILIIDDVYTTGATVDEISRVLIDNEVNNIYIMTFATGRNM